MNPKKAMIAMSGGVDSSVAAQLMLQAGYACLGATMRLYDGEQAEENATCCSLDDVEDARSVARRLGIPFHVFNCKAEFDEKVIRSFIRCYECGLTPNPCIECNRHLKFDHLLRLAKTLGCEYLVTGHYARVRQDETTGRYLLMKAVDQSKDQSYVLACIGQEQLAHIRFPLGEMTKAQAREIAEHHGFINARKRDSQDICFVPDGDYAGFMERYTGKTYPSGNFLDLEGKVVGTHKGVIRYTLGQRRGLGVAMGEPVYVCAKDMAANTVTLGPSEALMHSALRAENWNWFPFPALTEPMEVMARHRYNQKEQPATVHPEENGTARVEYHSPQRAITPGQAVVLYQGDTVIGSGTITEVLK